MSDISRFSFLTLLSLALVEITTKSTADFWLDETITAFVTGGGIHDVFERAQKFQGQSPLYFLVVWLVKQLGVIEWLYRLPSLIAVVVSSYYLSLVAKLLSLPQRLTLITFLLLPPVNVAAREARPYSLALLFSAASLYYALTFRRDGTYRSVTSYVSSATLLLYSHLLFALQLPLHFVLLLWRGNNWWSALALVVLPIALFLPAIAQVYSLWGSRASVSFAPHWSWGEMAEWLAPHNHLPLLILLLALLLERLFIGRTAYNSNSTFLPIALGWWLGPVIMLSLLSNLLGLGIFVERYLLWGQLGLALFIVCVLSRRKIVTSLVFSSLMLVVNLPERRQREPWRQAALKLARLNSGDNCTVMLYSGIAESRRIDLLKRDDYKGYFMSPFTRYVPQQLSQFLSPFSLDLPEQREYLTRQIGGAYCLIFLGPKVVFGATPAVEEYSRLLSRNGFALTQAEDSEGLVVAKYIKG